MGLARALNYPHDTQFRGVAALISQYFDFLAAQITLLREPRARGTSGDRRFLFLGQRYEAVLRGSGFSGQG